MVGRLEPPQSAWRARTEDPKAAPTFTIGKVVEGEKFVVAEWDDGFTWEVPPLPPLTFPSP